MVTKICSIYREKKKVKEKKNWKGSNGNMTVGKGEKGWERRRGWGGPIKKFQSPPRLD